MSNKFVDRRRDSLVSKLQKILINLQTSISVNNYASNGFSSGTKVYTHSIYCLSICQQQWCTTSFITSNKSGW